MLKKNEVFHNRVGRMLRSKKKTVGAWLQTASPITAEILAKADFDWLMVDMEHGPGDIMALIQQMQAVSRYDVATFVRAPWNDFVAIKRILDTGVHGILVPYVNTKEEAIRAVQACKYPLEGIRGVAGSPRAAGYGMDGMRYLEYANTEIVLLVAIETPEAVSNIHEILQVDGIDGIFVGPMDLATSTGYFGNPKAEEVVNLIRTVEKAVFQSDKFIGTVSGNVQQAIELYDRGYHFVTTMSDSTSLGALALNAVMTCRNHLDQTPTEDKF